MFNRLRFKWFYKRFRQAHYDAINGWEVSLTDVTTLFARLPVSVVRGFTSDTVRTLRNYEGDFHHPDVWILIAQLRLATEQILADGYVELPSEYLSPKRLTVAQWLQPTDLLVDFQELLLQAQQAITDFMTAYQQSNATKAGYYSRKTWYLVAEAMSLGEILSDLSVR